MSATRDEPVILNPRTGRRRGTAEFLGRDEERARHRDRPSPQSRRLSGRLGRPRRCVWCSAHFACLENTPVLQTRTMKRADAAQTANPASRPEKPGKMKSQRFSSPLIVRPLTVVAIDGLAGTPTRRQGIKNKFHPATCYTVTAGWHVLALLKAGVDLV